MSGFLSCVCIADGDICSALDNRKDNIRSHHGLRQNLHSAAVHHSIRGAPGKRLSLYCAHCALDQCGILYHNHVSLYFPGKHINKYPLLSQTQEETPEAEARQCTPRQKQWNPTIPGHCTDKHQAGVFSGSINALSDSLILILPLPLICRLQMSSKKKWWLLAVFGFGSFACVASVIRLVYSIKLTDDAPGHVSHQLEVDKQGLWA